MKLLEQVTPHTIDAGLAGLGHRGHLRRPRDPADQLRGQEDDNQPTQQADVADRYGVIERQLDDIWPGQRCDRDHTHQHQRQQHLPGIGPHIAEQPTDNAAVVAAKPQIFRKVELDVPFLKKVAEALNEYTHWHIHSVSVAARRPIVRATRPHLVNKARVVLLRRPARLAGRCSGSTRH